MSRPSTWLPTRLPMRLPMRAPTRGAVVRGTRPSIRSAVIAVAASLLLAVPAIGGPVAVAALRGADEASRRTKTTEPVTVRSLLAELADPTAPARVAPVAFESRLETSRDPRSIDPADRAGWFANDDRGHARRVERFGEGAGARDEWVLVDLEGPGAVVRVWTAFEEPLSQAVVRVRLDGESRPVIEAPLQDLLAGRDAVPSPIAAAQAPGSARWRSAVGGVLLLPVPFARRCVVTLDREPGYWQIAWRRYVEGTVVESLPADWSRSERGTLESTAEALGPGPRATIAEAPGAPAACGELRPGDAVSRTLAGPARVARLAVRIATPDDTSLRAALRDLWLEADFDGEACVRAPVGHFAGLGECRPPVVDRWRSARRASDGTVLLEWTMPMPFADDAAIVLRNRGGRAHAAAIDSIDAVTTAGDPPGRWRRLHAAFREDLGYTVADPDDWSMLAIEGSGEIVGVTLAYLNGSADWWGEGDEKIVIDGEPAPSQFGTGTEDFIGTAWGFPRALSSPFTGVAPRDDDARWSSRGRTAASRLRALDGIVFTRSIDLALERVPVPARGGRATIAATTIWYATPGASRPRNASIPATMPPNPEPPELARFVADRGAWLEAEDLAVVDATRGLRWDVQEIGTIAPRHAWSGGRHAFIRSMRPGDHWSVEIPVGPVADVDRTATLELRLACAPDYGTVDLEVDGEVLRRGVPLHADEVRPASAVLLDTVRIPAGRETVRLVLRVSKDEADPSERPRFVGFDAVRVELHGSSR